MSPSPKSPIKRTITKEQMENDKKAKFYSKKVSIITNLIGEEYDLPSICVKPLPCMRAFDVGLEFKWSKGISVLISIPLEWKWKETKKTIDKATTKLKNLLEGELGRCCICYEDLTAEQDNYSCACCNTMLCMCCVSKIRKDKLHFKCPICRTMNNCSHMLGYNGDKN